MQTFTDEVNNYIANINIEDLAERSDVMGVGERIAKLAQYLVRVQQECARRQAQYNQKLNEYLVSEGKSVAHAKIASEASQEFAELLKAKMLREAVIELIRALKYLARSMSDERSLS